MKRSDFMTGLVCGLSLALLGTGVYLFAHPRGGESGSLIAMAASPPAADAPMQTGQEPPTMDEDAAAPRVPLRGIGDVPGGRVGGADPRALRLSPVVEAARKVSPAVVSIGATKLVYTRPYDLYFYNFLAPYMLEPSARAYKFPYLGSGLILDKEGYIVTNYHVIEGAQQIFVTLVDGREFQADILDADVPVDVALLKIPASPDLPVAELGNSDDLMIGETALAIGNPFGNVLKDPHPTVTQGVISAVNRSFRPESTSDYARVYHDMIQTDAAINPGNSGGPLVNILGQVIGLNTFIISETGASHGLGFAIPINRVKAVVEEIKTFGHVRSIWWDFDVIDLIPRLREAIGTPAQSGAVVRIINKTGPAWRAGLRVEDVIVQVNDQKIASRKDLYAFLHILRVGETITLHVYRKDKPLTIQYVLQEPPKQQQ
ncbi:MAG: hypothetical protein Kow0059_14720 [Candidatus Sumerlaeia bacterium]